MINFLKRLFTTEYRVFFEATTAGGSTFTGSVVAECRGASEEGLLRRIRDLVETQSGISIEYITVLRKETLL